MTYFCYCVKEAFVNEHLDGFFAFYKNGTFYISFKIRNSKYQTEKGTRLYDFIHSGGIGEFKELDKGFFDDSIAMYIGDSE